MKPTLLLTLTLLCGASLAQRVDTLSEAHATAFRSRSFTASPHYRLDSTAIERQGITSLSDALRRLPGVTLRDYGGAGGLKTVSVRGMGSSHSQIMVDGLPVSNGLQGSVDLSRYALDELSGLSLSIADAPLLLTPVRSMAASTLELKSTESSGFLRLMGGSWNNWSPALGYSHQLGRHATRLGGLLHFSQGDNDYPYTLGDDRYSRSHSWARSFSGRLYSHTPLRHGEIRSAMRYWQSDRQLPGPVLYYNPDASQEEMHEQEFTLHSRWNFHRDRWSVYVAGQYTRQRSQYLNGSAVLTGPPDQRYSQNEGYISAGTAWQALPWLSVAYATDYTLQTLHSNLRTQHQVTRHSLQQAVSLRAEFLSMKWTIRLIDHLITDHLPSGNSKAPLLHRLTPSASLCWQALPALSLRAYYKEFFRAPTFTENYYYHLGSPQLLPERTRQWGAGLQFQQHSTHWNITVSADGFAGKVHNRIVAIPYNLFVWQMINKDNVRTAGAEGYATVSLQQRRHRWSLSGNYTLQYILAPGIKEVLTQLPYTPRHSGTIALCWENPWVCMSHSVTTAADRWTTLSHSPTTLLPRYAEWNASLWHTFRFHRTFPRWNRGFSLTLRGEILNILDHRYSLIARYPMPGRAFRVGVDISK